VLLHCKRREAPLPYAGKKAVTAQGYNIETHPKNSTEKNIEKQAQQPKVESKKSF